MKLEEQRVSGAGPFRESDAPAGDPSRGRTRAASRDATAARARRYGFLVGFGAGGCVGIGVRPPGGEVAPGGTPTPGGSGGADGFGANPQMLQLKRP